MWRFNRFLVNTTCRQNPLKISNHSFLSPHFSTPREHRRFETTVKQFQQNVDHPRRLIRGLVKEGETHRAKQGTHCDFEVVFLGTSSGSPTFRRNVTSAVVLLQKASFLFDCGEGTRRQMIFADVRVSRIDCIFISHMHGDHIFGLPGVLLSFLFNADQDTIRIYGPVGIRKYIRTSLSLSYARIKPHRVIIHEIVGPNEQSSQPPAKWESDVVMPVGQPCIIHQDEDNEVIGAFIKHTVPCIGYICREKDKITLRDEIRQFDKIIPDLKMYRSVKEGKLTTWTAPDGKVIDFRDYTMPLKGRKLGIITDTNDASVLIPALKGADLLIHECTLVDSDRREAGKRGHSTAAMAGRFAQNCEAKTLALTHFGGKVIDTERNEVENSIPDRRTAASRVFSGPILLAKDFMRVAIFRKDPSEESK